MRAAYPDGFEIVGEPNLINGRLKVRVSESVFREARASVKQHERKRSWHHETGGRLWGLLLPVSAPSGGRA